MAEPVRVGWDEILALSAAWENALLDAIELLPAPALVRLLDPSSPELAHLYIMSYPAAAHADVVEGDLLRGRFLTQPPLALDQRIGLVACQPAVPEVTQSQVHDELNRQLGTNGIRHPLRAHTVEEFRDEAVLWLMATIKRAGLSLALTQQGDGVVESDSDPLEGSADLWLV